jgi:hypothetical protein
MQCQSEDTTHAVSDIATVGGGNHDMLRSSLTFMQYHHAPQVLHCVCT